MRQLVIINSLAILILGIIACLVMAYLTYCVMLKDYHGTVHDVGYFFRSVACAFAASIVGLTIIIIGGGIKIIYIYP